MTSRKIVIYPDEVLKKKTRKVENFDSELKILTEDMAETMYFEQGVGLAANQIGVNMRVAMVDVEHPEGKPNLIVMVNPEIAEKRGEITWEEGCLSFPEILVDVLRSEHVLVRAMDIKGKTFEFEAEGLLAVACQHEIDHLNGITLADKVGYLRRKMMLKDLRKIKAGMANND
jgi:peptide deformylase